MAPKAAIVMAAIIAPCGGRKLKERPLEDDLRTPTRQPTEREAADSGVRLAAAQTMPWFPTHKTLCDGHPCRPGEGNLPHVREETERGWRYKQWAQPYIHREAWVQSRSRRPPHDPDPRNYAQLVHVARQVAKEGLVVVTSGDWDYRELVLNWAIHAHRLGYHNALVLAMDAELYAELRRRRIPASDLSQHALGWNATCMQRHIQAVRTERHLAVAALVASGIDVLHTDATCVLVGDVMRYLRGLPGWDGIDVLAQRDEWPADPLRKVGSAANAGLYYVRARKQRVAAALLRSIVERGMIEFYLRWNNIPDQYGLSFVLADTRGISTSLHANETSVGTLHPRGSHCARSGDCLQAGFLPYDRFPRVGSWEALKATALVYHLTYGCVQESAPCSVPGIRPFRGHRQRLDRYEAVDFDDQVATLRGLGLWLVDASPDYAFNFSGYEPDGSAAGGEPVRSGARGVPPRGGRTPVEYMRDSL